MNIYSHLLFQRGFLLTDIKLLTFKDLITQKTIDRWTSVSFGNYYLYFDNDLPSTIIEENDYKIALLGLVLNPFDELNNKNIIASKLLSKKQKSEEEFLNYLDELSGRFVIISQTPSLTEVYNDACGTRTVYYDTKKNHTVISSHSTVIADLLGYKQSKIASDLLTHKDFVGRRYLPGLLSPYDEISPLIPNTKYQVENRSIIRIFPRSPLQEEINIDELVNELALIMKTQAALLSENNKISISLTAGLDSRLTYAAQNDIYGDIDYFTHINTSNPKAYEEDVRIGTKLAEIKNAPYKVYEYPTSYNQEEMLDFKVIWEKNIGMKRGSMHLFKMYADNFPKERIHVRSNIAEIGRVFYKNRSENMNARKLARLYSKSKISENPIVIKSFQDFINTNHFNKENFFNYDYQDLFYWEHRMPMWHSWIVLESDVAHETFVPYNNRILLSKMLSAPFDTRESGSLFVRMIKEMWPKILELPVNKEIVKP